MKILTGSKNYEDVIKKILKGYKVPGYKAAVYRDVYDTGYPGFFIASTKVELYGVDGDLEKKIIETLHNLGFE